MCIFPLKNIQIYFGLVDSAVSWWCWAVFVDSLHSSVKERCSLPNCIHIQLHTQLLAYNFQSTNNWQKNWKLSKIEIFRFKFSTNVPNKFWDQCKQNANLGDFKRNEAKLINWLRSKLPNWYKLWAFFILIHFYAFMIRPRLIFISCFGLLNSK